jgi:cold shock CspA family protein
MAYARRAMFTGKIVRYFRQAGYGFIRIDGNPREAHFHVDDFDHVGPDELKTGDRIFCFLEDAKRGLKAIRIIRDGSQ